MGHIVLQRQLIYTNATSEDILMSRNDFNKELWTFLDDEFASLFAGRMNKLRLINEMYYQLTRANEDPNPAEGVYNNYYKDINQDLRAGYDATDVCICCMWLLLDNMANIPDKLVPFKSELVNVVKDMFAVGIVKQHSVRLASRKFEIDLTPTPVKPSLLKVDREDDWALATEGYDKSVIRTIIDRYKNQDDKVEILNMMRADYPIFVKLTRGGKKASEIFANHSIRERYFWIYVDNADRADEQFFQEVEKEIYSNFYQKLSFDFDEPKSCYKKNNNDLKVLIDFWQNVDRLISDNLGRGEFKFKISKSEAKVDMLSKENDQLRARVKELEDQLSEKQEKLQIVKEERNRLAHSIPVESHQPNPMQEVDDCFQFKKIVKDALSNYQIEYVDHCLRMMYRLSGSVVSDKKTKLINLVENWHNQLAAHNHGVHIDTFVQTGGNSISELHNHIDEVDNI